MADINEYRELAEYNKRKAEIEAKGRKLLQKKSLPVITELKTYWDGIYKKNRYMDEKSQSLREEASMWIEIIDKIMREKATAVESEDHPVVVTDNKYLDLEQAASFLNMSKSTLYKKTSAKEIPHSKQGKKLHFDKQELEKYLASGHVKTKIEIEEEAAEFVANKDLKKNRRK